MRLLLVAMLLLVPLVAAYPAGALVRTRRQLRTERARRGELTQTVARLTFQNRDVLTELRDHPLTDPGTAAMLDVEINRLHQIQLNAKERS